MKNKGMHQPNVNHPSAGSTSAHPKAPTAPTPHGHQNPFTGGYTPTGAPTNQPGGAGGNKNFQKGKKSA